MILLENVKLIWAKLKKYLSSFKKCTDKLKGFEIKVVQILVDFRELEKWQFLVVVFLDTVCLNSVKGRENKQIKMQSREQPSCIQEI